ncbi:hypothetical protein ACFVWY_31165 [Streptomyces sp. NPDC058195]|uniref:hypothetical protein n=1 Tax=Streptomyces sp. NPDC058195 TaxID=3346375 RepID=UPI0036E44C40
MYAPAHPPTPPRRIPGRAWIVSMRVLFIVLTVGSVGLLLWTPLLRLAIVRRRAADWWLTGAGFVLVCVLLPVLGRDGGDEPTGIDNVLIPLLLLAMAGSIAYYLVGDIRHVDRLAKARAMPGPPPGYAYAQTVPALPSPVPVPAPVHVPRPQPQPQQPPLPPQHPRPYPQQQQQQQQQHQPQPQQPPHAQPQPQPQPQHPRPQRIDQVRAELDELSDYLRKEEGR